MVIHKIQGLTGTYTIPGDKSISHRAIMFGSIAKGTTHIRNFLKGADCFSTIDCFRAMGIQIDETEEEIVVHGKGLHGLSAPSLTGATSTKSTTILTDSTTLPNTSTTILDVGNSGTTTRLISGILSGQTFETTLSGDASLNSRPMKRIQTPLCEMGANIESINHNDCAPLHITPSKLHGITYYSPVASAQVKSAILLAGLYADSKTTVLEPSLSRNHTELMLQQFGATIETSYVVPDHNTIAELNTTAKLNTITDQNNLQVHIPQITIHPCEELYAQDIIVPGDISSAAYYIAAGLLVPDSDIIIENVGINPTRAGILEVCKNMGAEIEYLNERSAGGEPVADLHVKTSTLQGTIIKGDIIPTLIDELPMIAVMAACANGTTIIKDAAELKVKESNRIDTVVEGLLAMGVDITPTDDGMIIKGNTNHSLQGAQINSYMDHRIAMSFAIAGLVADGDTEIIDSHCVDISFPTFWKSNLF